MATFLKKTFCLNASKLKCFSSHQLYRNYWHRDWKPALFPESREAREKAAKKYNLSPDEYEPYSDDGVGYGDYPKLPEVSAENKDPYYPYDFPEHKRNFNEPLHVEADMYGEDRININNNPKYSSAYQVTCFLTIVLGTFGLYIMVDNNRMVVPVLPKQYPESGEVHFTFESK